MIDERSGADAFIVYGAVDLAGDGIKVVRQFLFHFLGAAEKHDGHLVAIFQIGHGLTAGTGHGIDKLRHTAADVEQENERHGFALAVEVGGDLLGIFIEDDEVFLFETSKQAGPILHLNVDADDVCAAFKYRHILLCPKGSCYN